MSVKRGLEEGEESLAKVQKTEVQSTVGREEWMKVMAMDLKCRVPGIEDGLIVVQNMEFKEWDFSLPTLAWPQKLNAQPRAPPPLYTAGEFRQRIQAAMPYLGSMDWSNVLLAGGAVFAFVNPSKNPDKYVFGDLDFFLYGLKSPEEASARAIK